MEEVNKLETLQDLVGALRKIFEDDRVNVELVTKTMAAYKSNPLDWKKYAKFDKYRYTRNLIDEGNGKYNLMLLCWGGGQGSAIHDHADAHCFMKMMAGSLQEVRFSWPSQSPAENGDDFQPAPMQEISRTVLPCDSICYINDSLGLHRVENLNYGESAVSLHLYCPPFEECGVFNQQTGQRSTCKVTFWSKYGNKPDRKIQDSRPPEDN